MLLLIVETLIFFTVLVLLRVCISVVYTDDEKYIFISVLGKTVLNLGNKS